MYPTPSTTSGCDPLSLVDANDILFPSLLYSLPYLFLSVTIVQGSDFCFCSSDLEGWSPLEVLLLGS